MSDEIIDFPVALAPQDVYSNLVNAAAEGGVCPFDKGDGSPPAVVSAYKYFTEVAKNPSLQSPQWKQLVAETIAGVAGSTAGGAVGLATAILGTGPLAPFTALAAVIAAPYFAKNRVATIIVCNVTNGEMKKSEIYLNCGVQTGQPAYVEFNDETGSQISSKPDLIPGYTQIVPGTLLAGVGMYRFEKNLDLGLGVYGSGGAISWECTDPAIKTKMALAWLVPESGDLGLAVTADLSKYSSLSDFYNKTADVRKGELRSFGVVNGNQRPRIKAFAAPRNYPDSSDAHDVAITVYVGV